MHRYFRLTFSAVLLCCLRGSLVAQAPLADAEKNFRDAVVKKRLYVRSLSAEPVVTMRWSGTRMEINAPTVRSLSVFVAESVNIKGSSIRVKGKRITLLQSKNKGLVDAPSKSPQELDIDAGNADLSEFLASLPDRIFYADLSAAEAIIPKELQLLIPYSPNEPVPEGSDTSTSMAPCDCATADPGLCKGRGPQVGLTQPKVVKAADPVMPPDARAGREDGSVEVALKVSETGLPQDLWVAMPGGASFDAAAVRAVRQYVFRPATCQGEPKAVGLSVDVNFAFH